MPYRILLVDDELVIRLALKKFIQKSGYEIDTCESGKQALEFMARQVYDLLLTDYLMQGMKGSELISKLKAKQPALKTILFSGCKELAFANQNGEHYPPDRILAKPIELDTLLANIASLLQA